MMTHIGYVIVIRGGHSGSFSGLFEISYSVQIFEDSVRFGIVLESVLFFEFEFFCTILNSDIKNK